MAGCPIYLTVRYKDGSPAAFASVDVFEVVWFWDKHVASKTADMNGRVSFDLTKGKKYRFVFRAKGKRGDDWRTMDYCPIYRGVQFPT